MALKRPNQYFRTRAFGKCGTRYQKQIRKEQNYQTILSWHFRTSSKFTEKVFQFSHQGNSIAYELPSVADASIDRSYTEPGHLTYSRPLTGAERSWRVEGDFEPNSTD